LQNIKTATKSYFPLYKTLVMNKTDTNGSIATKTTLDQNCAEASTDNLQASLGQLNDEYRRIAAEEVSLTEVLERLHREEAMLKEALQEASETGAERLRQQRLERETSALARLEDALMGESSSDEEVGK
jgi:predicted nuclease with TOPRIM domain